MGQANTAPCLSISSQIQGTWEADKAKIVIFNFKLYIQHAIMLFVFKKKMKQTFSCHLLPSLHTITPFLLYNKTQKLPSPVR